MTDLDGNPVDEEVVRKQIEELNQKGENWEYRKKPGAPSPFPGTYFGSRACECLGSSGLSLIVMAHPFALCRATHSHSRKKAGVPLISHTTFFAAVRVRAFVIAHSITSCPRFSITSTRRCQNVQLCFPLRLRVTGFESKLQSP